MPPTRATREWNWDTSGVGVEPVGGRQRYSAHTVKEKQPDGGNRGEAGGTIAVDHYLQARGNKEDSTGLGAARGRDQGSSGRRRNRDSSGRGTR